MTRMQCNRYIEENLAFGFNMNTKSFTSNVDMQKVVSSTQNHNYRNHKKSRRFRSAFTTEQVYYLEKEFKKHPYIGITSRQELANVLKISERAIKIWFQNRRMREKKETSTEVNNMNHNKIIIGNLSNDQLNNANNVQSSNDEMRATTSLTHANEGTNVKHEVTDDCKTKQAPRKQATISAPIENEITTTCTQRKSPNHSILQEERQRVQTQVFQNKNSRRLSKDHEDLPNKKGFSSNVLNNLNVLQSQDIPQDLSQRILHPFPVESHFGAEGVTRDTGNTSVYLQSCFTPPCVTGNMIWKPINMGSLIPDVATVSNNYHASPYVINTQNLRRTNCNCDCHLQYPAPVIQNQSQAQFIPLFTIPYPRSDI